VQYAPDAGIPGIIRPEDPLKPPSSREFIVLSCGNEVAFHS